MQHSYTRRSPWLFMLVLKLVLLAMIAGVCSASPLPQGNTVKKPEPSARSKGLKDRIFGHYNIGPKEVILGYAWMKEKTTDRVTPTEILEAELSSIASHSTSHASVTASSGSSTNSPEDAARKAIEKLKTLSDILEAMTVSDGSRTVKYNYFFPSPNYFDVMVPGGSEQGQGWVSLRTVNQLDVVYIPETIKLTKKMVKKHIENHKSSKKVKLSEITVLVELGGGYYALLVPSSGKFKFQVSFNFDDKDLPAAHWENFEGVKKQKKLQRVMPKRFY
ncbi:hypothetical protein GGU10DRAFT_435890 [Lentinula aff. detonsa]|uniref:Uncharacterized protein n=1 Tax=Lentinula aff. detonsa TaxID=2804958 RepID=A0AA38KDH1_9AGAR|nr:hypothetical protein GGU10DRAFT_435890 [Lentinula aff. detonsa]